MEVAMRLQSEFQPSGVVIFTATESAGPPLMDVVAITAPPIGYTVEDFTRPRMTISQIMVEINHELIIDDTLVHPLVRSGEVETTMGVMAFLGVPVRYKGAAVGGVSAIHQTRRSWNTDEIYAVRRAAASMGDVFAKRRKRRFLF